MLIIQRFERPLAMPYLDDAQADAHTTIVPAEAASQLSEAPEAMENPSRTSWHRHLFPEF